MGTENVQESIKLSQEKRQEDKLGIYGESKGGKVKNKVKGIRSITGK